MPTDFKCLTFVAEHRARALDAAYDDVATCLLVGAGLLALWMVTTAVVEAVRPTPPNAGHSISKRDAAPEQSDILPPALHARLTALEGRYSEIRKRVDELGKAYGKYLRDYAWPEQVSEPDDSLSLEGVVREMPDPGRWDQHWEEARLVCQSDWDVPTMGDIERVTELSALFHFPGASVDGGLLASLRAFRPSQCKTVGQLVEWVSQRGGSSAATFRWLAAGNPQGRAALASYVHDFRTDLVSSLEPLAFLVSAGTAAPAKLVGIPTATPCGFEVPLAIRSLYLDTGLAMKEVKAWCEHHELRCQAVGQSSQGTARTSGSDGGSGSTSLTAVGAMLKVSVVLALVLAPVTLATHAAAWLAVLPTCP